MKHYLQARESDFQIAISTDPFESGAASGAVAVHNPVQHRDDVASHQAAITHETPYKMQVNATLCDAVQQQKVTPTGLEPVLPA